MSQAYETQAIPALQLEDIRAARQLLGDRVVTTPVHEWQSQTIGESLGTGARVFMKLELLQRTGSFKARGALLNLLRLTAEQRERGVTAISAGNHAIAVAYAAQVLGVHAKVVMIKTANPFRVALCRSHGADVEFAADAHIVLRRLRRTRGGR